MKKMTARMDGLVRWGLGVFKQHINGISACIAVVVFYVLLQLLIGMTCPIKFLTGISCAGCGMTRAWMAVLRLDFAAAFGCHPLFWLVPFAAVVLLAGRHFPRMAVRVFWILTVGAFLVVYAVRMANPSEIIVVFEPESGLVGRIVLWLWKQILQP